MSMISDSKLAELIEINTDSTILSVLQELKERRNSDWISVKDRLPEINVAEGDCSEEVLIVVKGEVISGTRYWVDGLFEDYHACLISPYLKLGALRHVHRICVSN